MEKRITILSIFIFSLAIFSSCSENYDSELKQIEELSVRVKLLQTTFEEVDMEKVNLAKDTYKKTMSSVSKYYQTDTIEYDFAHTLSLYKGIKKTGDKISESYKVNNENLGLLVEQLDKLKIDLQNNTIPKDSVQNYIDFEMQNVTKLSDDIGTFVSNCQFIIETHDTYAEKVRGYTIAFNN